MYGVTVARPTLSNDTMAALIAAAYKRGKVAAIHIGSLPLAEDAINAGADGLGHLFVGRNRSSTLESSRRNTASSLFPRFRCSRQSVDSNAALAQDARVKTMLTAKDGCPERDLQLAKQAGLTPMQALAAGTPAPTKAFHLDNRGVIASGKRADLLLVGGDPTRAITDTPNIVAVFKQGERQIAMPILRRSSWRTKLPIDKPQPRLAADRKRGLVSDFESGKPDAAYGKWQESSDAIAGGKSTAKLEVVAPGAGNSEGAVRITGEVLRFAA